MNDSLGVRPLQALNRPILKGSVPAQSQSLVPEQNILRGKEPQGSSPAPGSAQASSGISYSRSWWGFGKPDSEMINKGFAGCEVWLSPCLECCRAEQPWPSLSPTDGSSPGDISAAPDVSCPCWGRAVVSVLAPTLGQGHTSCSTVPQASSMLFLSPFQKQHFNHS